MSSQDDDESPAHRMRAALTGFSPSWDDVIALGNTYGEQVTCVVAGPEQDSALHFAAYWGELSVIKALLEQSADRNARNQLHATPIHLAAINGKSDAIGLLVERGADVNLFDLDGNAPIHTACTVGDDNVLTALLSCGADPVAHNSVNGNTPCHICAREGYTNLCMILAGKGNGEAVLSATNDAGEQPLHRAAAHGQREAAAMLIKLGANIHASDENGDQPLHLAAMFGMSETAGELIALGASVDAKDDDCQTPLHLACAFKQVSSACTLIRCGADSSLVNDEGQTCREIAIANNLTEVLECLNDVSN